MNTKLTKLLLPFAAVVLLSACSDNDDPVVKPTDPTPVPDPNPAYVRVTHAGADAPDVNVLVDGSAALEGVAYQMSSGWLELDPAEYAVQVDALLPGDETAAVIEASLTLESDTTYDVIALGMVASADMPLEPLVITNDFTSVTAGNARLQVVHAAANAPMVDIYLTAPDADLAMESPVATASYKDYTAQVEVTAGDYQIRITPAGDAETVVFDSGTVNLADGSDLLVMATPNTASGDSPVALLVADGTESSVLLDADAGADVRVVHAVADAPAVDVFVDGAEAVSALEFMQGTDYVNLSEGSHGVTVAAAADNSVVVIDDAQVDLMKGASYSIFAVGELTESSINPAVLMDMPRRIATAAQVRIIHASPSAGEVDIYVTASEDISDADPAFAAVPFSNPDLAETGYVQLAAGDYVVSVTAAGTKTVALGPLPLTLEANKIYTAVAVDMAGGGLPPTLITLDDF